MGRKRRNIYLKTNAYVLYSEYRHFEIWPMFFLLSVFSTLEGTFLRFKSDVMQRFHYNSHHIIFSKTFFTLQ